MDIKVQPVDRQQLSECLLGGGGLLIVLAIGKLIAHLIFGWSSFLAVGVGVVMGVILLLVGAWLHDSSDADSEE
jgi:type IV secretory pathway TrbD component